MIDYKIIHTPAGVSVRTQEMVQTTDGRQVPVGPKHAKSIGLRDFAADPLNPTDAEIERGKAAITELLENTLTSAGSSTVAEVALAKEQLREERQARQAAIAERDAERQAKREAEKAIIAERAEKAQLANQLEQARADVQRAGLQQKPQQGGRE